MGSPKWKPLKREDDWLHLPVIDCLPCTYGVYDHLAKQTGTPGLGSHLNITLKFSYFSLKLSGRNKDFPGKNKDFPGKNRDFPGKNKDFLGKNKDFSVSPLCCSESPSHKPLWLQEPEKILSFTIRKYKLETTLKSLPTPVWMAAVTDTKSIKRWLGRGEPRHAGAGNANRSSCYGKQGEISSETVKRSFCI